MLLRFNDALLEVLIRMTNSTASYNLYVANGPTT